MDFIIYLNAKHFLCNENYTYKKVLRNMPRILLEMQNVKILSKLVKFLNSIAAKFA